MMNVDSFNSHGLFDDWGFWYTVTSSLQLVKKKMNEYDVLEADKHVVTERIEKLLKFLHETPKTKKWEKRSKVGTQRSGTTRCVDLGSGRVSNRSILPKHPVSIV